MASPGVKTSALDCFVRGLYSLRANWQLVPLVWLQQVVVLVLTFGSVVALLLPLGVGTAAFRDLSAYSLPELEGWLAELGTNLPQLLLPLLLGLVASLLVGLLAFLVFCWLQAGITAVLIAGERQALPGEAARLAPVPHLRGPCLHRLGGALLVALLLVLQPLHAAGVADPPAVGAAVRGRRLGDGALGHVGGVRYRLRRLAAPRLPVSRRRRLVLPGAGRPGARGRHRAQRLAPRPGGPRTALGGAASPRRPFHRRQPRRSASPSSRSACCCRSPATAASPRTVAGRSSSMPARSATSSVISLSFLASMVALMRSEDLPPTPARTAVVAGGEVSA